MTVDLFESVTECGCAAKVPAPALAGLLRGMEVPTNPAVLVGPDTLDDAGVYQLSVVLQACHSYNVESHRVETNIQKNHGLPFIKVVTDYSSNYMGRIRSRMEALLEMCS